VPIALAHAHDAREFGKLVNLGDSKDRLGRDRTENGFAVALAHEVITLRSFGGQIDLEGDDEDSAQY
jgi:hypothetical protein